MKKVYKTKGQSYGGLMFKQKMGSTLLIALLMQNVPLQSEERYQTAAHIIVESPQGSFSFLEVDEQDSFFKVVELLKEELINSQEGNAIDYIPDAKPLQLEFIDENVIFVKTASKGTARNYYATISPQDFSDISFIIKTLANESLLKIKKQESSLKRAGERIDSIHPLLFLATIFSDEELKVAMHNLQGRSWVWKRFLGDLVSTLKEENNKSNIMPYTEDFSARIALDASLFKPLVKEGRWEKFVNLLIEKVPRNGDADRYKM